MNDIRETLVHKTDPQTFNLIKDAVESYSRIETLTLPVAVFLCTRKILMAILPPSQRSDLVTSIFYYYLEIYYAITTDPKSIAYIPPEVDGVPVPPEIFDFTIRNAAALSLFDLYTRQPEMLMTHKLLQKGLDSINEVYASIVSQNPSTYSPNMFVNSTNTNLIINTFGTYLKGKRRRQNFEYVLWVREYMLRLLADCRKDSIVELPNQKNILIALRRRDPVISITD